MTGGIGASETSWEAAQAISRLVSAAGSLYNLVRELFHKLLRGRPSLAERKRILVVSVTEAPADGLFAEGRADWDLIRVPTLREALERIQAERFDAIVAPTTNPRVLRRLNTLLQ